MIINSMLDTEYGSVLMSENAKSQPGEEVLQAEIFCNADLAGVGHSSLSTLYLIVAHLLELQRCIDCCPCASGLGFL